MQYGDFMNSFLVGLQFMTRIHLSRQVSWADEEFGKSVKWFPLYGWIIGLFLCLLHFLLEPFQLPLLQALLLMIGELYISGGTLADGLMDTADGVFSGRSRERCLEIMKDSLIGSYGMLSILIYMFLTVISISYIEDSQLYMLLFAMPVLSRFNIVISICEYPYARPYGMGKSFSSYRDKYAVTAAAVFALLPALYFGFIYLLLTGVSVMVGLGLNRWIAGKIGGTTGDTYGFVAETSQAFLALFYVFLTRGFL